MISLREGLGVSGQGFYFGGGIKWTLVHASTKVTRPGVALWLGGHFHTSANVAGADAMIAVDYPFSRVRPYLGLDANLEFASSDVQFLLGLVAGVKIGIARNISWFVEGGLGIVGDVKANFIATGPRIYI